MGRSGRRGGSKKERERERERETETDDTAPLSSAALALASPARVSCVSLCSLLWRLLKYTCLESSEWPVPSRRRLTQSKYNKCFS